MFAKIYKTIQSWEKRFYHSFGDDITTPKGRRQAVWHTHIVDHAWIRKLWPNMYPLGAQAWRSNQPDPKRFEKLKQLGIRSIINLRGASRYASYLFEQESCAAYDIALYNHELDARSLGTREDYLRLLDLFARVEKPLLLHCKSGADRAGLAAALYMLDQERVTADEALNQLALKYAHRKSTGTGILDHLLEQYRDDSADTPMSIREWFETRYDRVAITRSFAISRGKAP